MHNHKAAAAILEVIDLGSSIAELDNLLHTARVETSAFSDLLLDKVDLIPGTKGSGKSALFRIFTDFLPDHLLRSRKVVVAHGVQKHGDDVFHAFKDQFDQLSEDDFVSFWCIYLTSLAHEQFVKGEAYREFLVGAEDEINQFRQACEKAGIPEIKAKKSLRDILAWALNVLKVWRPKLTYKLPHDGGAVDLDLFGCVLPQAKSEPKEGGDQTPRYISDVKERLEAILKKAELSIWLMIDRLDEIFPRRTELEKRALRGLLRSLRLFSTDLIRIKIFLRDDMLEQIAGGPDGFTALTHLTARQADTLCWSEDQILTMLTKRLFADAGLVAYLKIDKARLEASRAYREECFYKVFPQTVHAGEKQSDTLHWIFTHTSDGRGVVTPRDVLDLVSRAKQHQQDEFSASPSAESPWLIGPKSVLHGLEALSKRKRDTYLKAEFPHLWPSIEKFEGGKTEYEPATLQKLLGSGWEKIVADLVSIGVMSRKGKGKDGAFVFPHLYRRGLSLSQGRA